MFDHVEKSSKPMQPNLDKILVFFFIHSSLMRWNDYPFRAANVCSWSARHFLTLFRRVCVCSRLGDSLQDLSLPLHPRKEKLIAKESEDVSNKIEHCMKWIYLIKIA